MLSEGTVDTSIEIPELGSPSTSTLGNLDFPTAHSSAAMASLTSAVNSDPVIARLQKQTKSKNSVIKRKSTPKAKGGENLKAKTNPKPSRASQLANGGKKKSSVENQVQKLIKAQKKSTDFDVYSREEMPLVPNLSTIIQGAEARSRAQSDIVPVFPTQPLPRRMECFVCFTNFPCNQLKAHRVCKDTICETCFKKTLEYFLNRKPKNEMDNGSFSQVYLYLHLLMMATINLPVEK